MKKPNPYPVPKMRFKGRPWDIYWYWDSKQYHVYPGVYKRENENIAASIMHQIAVELSKERPEFNDDLMTYPGIRKYLADRYGANSPDELKGDWLEAYDKTLRTTVGKGWYKHSRRYLERLKAFTGDISKVTSNQAQEYLNAMIEEGLSPATHNKALAACSKFFEWAARTHRTRRNPFKGIKQLKESKSNQIIYCTKEERDFLIEMAQSDGWPDWLSIPLAFYAGMRREEIARLVWEDIRFEAGIIVVTITKTQKSRETPLASALEKILLAVPKAQRVGYVVLMDHRANERDTEDLRADRLTAYVRHLKTVARRQRPEISLERIGWNPFRHTFGSLLAQGGVSIDKISSWMGNTPDVCRRHYAQFIPRDRRDDEIDKL